MILSLYRTIEPNIHLRMASILTSTVKKTQVCLNLVEKPVLLGPAVRSHFWEIPSEAGLHCRDSPNPYLAKSLRKSFQIQTAECGLLNIYQHKKREDRYRSSLPRKNFLVS